MTGFPSIIALAAIMACAGFGAGLAYFAMVRKTAMLLAGGGGWQGPAMLSVGRMAGALVFLLLAAKLGAPALLSAFVGFLLARQVQLRLAKRAVL